MDYGDGLLRHQLPYKLPIGSPGKVELRLHFAELNWGAPNRGPAGPGKRIFDVTAEGETVMDNFDITAASGRALSATVVQIGGVQVSDGTLNLQFKAQKDYASIAAIEVLRA